MGWRKNKEEDVLVSLEKKRQREMLEVKVTKQMNLIKITSKCFEFRIAKERLRWRFSCFEPIVQKYKKNLSDLITALKIKCLNNKCFFSRGGTVTCFFLSSSDHYFLIFRGVRHILRLLFQNKHTAN